MSPPPSKNGKDSALARILGSGLAGLTELVIFHPVDTVAKRLMNNNSKSTNYNQIIFPGSADQSIFKKYKSLFPGIGFAAGYKISQRIYKFGGQPIATDYITRHHSDSFTSTFGERHGKMIIHATAGSLIGIGEVALLPFDVLKIKMQTNPDFVRGRGVGAIFREEGIRGLYKGAGWTAARNAPGSFALFGGSALVKGTLFGLEDYRKASLFQNFTASIAGALLSITVSAPLDTVKTRIQASLGNESGRSVVMGMIKNEGIGSFWKGLTPKILVVGPKLIFSFTVAQQLIPVISDLIDAKK